MKKSKLFDLLQKNQITIKKSLGQNYLFDTNYLKKISNAVIHLKKKYPDSFIVEIGCGVGMLTSWLLEIDSVLGIEIDKRNCQILKKEYSSFLVPNAPAFFSKKKSPCFFLLEEDVLSIPFNDFLQNKKVIVVGNLPYHLVYEIIFYFLENYFSFISEMVLMMQKEVGERIRNTLGQKNYGITTVMINYHCEVKKLFELPANAFYPAPKIKSELVQLNPKKRENIASYSLFKHLVKASFQNRRKNIFNSIKNYRDYAFDLNALENILVKLRIRESRAEKISIENYVSLSNEYFFFEKT